MSALARIINNSNQWKAPSGRLDKSKHKRTHEHEYGFGFDEWFLNDGLCIDGRQCGFLRPFATKHSSVKTTEDVFLYMQDDHRQRLVASINLVHHLHFEEAKKIRNTLADIKWDQKAIEDLSMCLFGKELDGAIQQFKRVFWEQPLDLVNVAFDLTDLQLCVTEYYLDPFIVRKQRYRLLRKPFEVSPHLKSELLKHINLSSDLKVA